MADQQIGAGKQRHPGEFPHGGRRRVGVLLERHRKVIVERAIPIIRPGEHADVVEGIVKDVAEAQAIEHVLLAGQIAGRYGSGIGGAGGGFIGVGGVRRSWCLCG